MSVYILPFSCYLDRDGLRRGTDGEGSGLFAGIQCIVAGAACLRQFLCGGFAVAGGAGLFLERGPGWGRCAEWGLGVAGAGAGLSMGVIWSVGSTS